MKTSARSGRRASLFLLLAGTALACQSLPDAYPPRLENEALGLQDQDAVRIALRKQFGAPKALRTPAALGFNAKRLLQGQRSFVELCARCHGSVGNGRGTWHRGRRGPRDFTRGAFKFTSTGGTPTREDLLRTIREGLPGTIMPAFPQQSSSADALVDYVQFIAIRGALELRLILTLKDEGAISEAAVKESLKDLAGLWAGASKAVIVPKRPSPAVTPKSIARGRQLFVSARAKCFECHGLEADGEGERSLVDDWGKAIEASDLTEGEFRGGSRGIDIYRRIAGGIPGTPMPGLKGALRSDEIWDLVHFVKSLSED